MLNVCVCANLDVYVHDVLKHFVQVYVLSIHICIQV